MVIKLQRPPPLSPRPAFRCLQRPVVEIVQGSLRGVNVGREPLGNANLDQLSCLEVSARPPDIMALFLPHVGLFQTVPGVAQRPILQAS